MPVVSAEDLRALMRELLIGAGTAEDVAMMVGDSLVNANLAGHDSHGVIRVLHYLDMVDAGQVHPTADPVLIREGLTRWYTGHDDHLHIRYCEKVYPLAAYRC